MSLWGPNKAVTFWFDSDARPGDLKAAVSRRKTPENVPKFVETTWGPEAASVPSEQRATSHNHSLMSCYICLQPTLLIALLCLQNPGLLCETTVSLFLVQMNREGTGRVFVVTRLCNLFVKNFINRALKYPKCCFDVDQTKILIKEFQQKSDVNVLNSDTAGLVSRCRRTDTKKTNLSEWSEVIVQSEKTFWNRNCVFLKQIFNFLTWRLFFKSIYQ